MASIFGSRKRREKEEKIERQALLPVVLLFLASGLSSLIYQVVWTRTLVLIFGATTFATSTVLAIFMGGLALGSFLAGRVADRTKNPLLWYGILEGVIGFWALIAPFLFQAATPAYKWIWLHTHADLIPFSLLRFLATALILIVPTTCMGATLPLLARYVTRNLDVVGRRVGALYAVNTLGAIFGAVLSGFVLLPAIGLNASTWCSAGLNFALMAIVLIMSARMGQKALVAPVGDLSSNALSQVKQALPVPVMITMLAFGISGAIAMIYEVCWTRALLMVIGSSTYAFTVMLTAFLIGIFLGSLICARFVDRAKQPYLWFAILQLSVGALTIVSMRLFNMVPYLNLVINNGFHGDVNASMFSRLFLAGLIMTPITLCLGAIFPVVVKACTLELSAVGRSVGSLYSANTLGAIIGAFLAGFVLIPLMGSEQTLMWSALINFWLGLIILWTCTALKWPVAIGSLISVVFLAVSMNTSSLWDKNVLLMSQVYRRNLFTSGLPASYEDWRDRLNREQKVEFWEDGPCSNVGVVYSEASKVTSLITNGHVDASDSLDQPVQSLVSGFPMLLKPNAADVAVIGWGSGQTVGTVLQFPVKSVEAIELEPAVVKAANRFFKHVNHEPEKDRRVHVQFNDGRNFMLATDQKFDVIVSEPSNPWQAGVCNLFTSEYFKICKDRLKPDGLFAMWFQSAEVPPKNLLGVLSSLKQNYRYITAFLPRAGNLVLVASESPIKISVPELKKVFTNPALQKEFANVSIPDYASFLGRLVVAADGLDSFVVTEPNTDDRNKLEFDVGRTYENETFVKENRTLLASMSGSPWKMLDWGEISPDEKATALAKMSRIAIECGDPALAYTYGKMSYELKPNAEALQQMGFVLNDQKNTGKAMELWSKALQLDPNKVECWQMVGSVKVNLGQIEEGRKDLYKALALDPENKNTRFLLASSYTHDLVGRPLRKPELDSITSQNPILKAESYLKGLPEDAEYCKSKPGVYFLAAEINFKMRRFKESEKYLQQFRQLQPEWDVAQRYEHVVRTYATGGEIKELEEAKLPAGK